MRKALLLMAMTWLAPQLVAQPSEQLARTFQLDLAVPDAPALLLLERDGAAILRPSTVRAAAIAASDFFGEGGRFVVPDEIGVEVSPGLLIGGQDLSVSEYRRAPWLYRLRLSIATMRGAQDDATSALALGLRVNTVDRSDLRTSRDYEIEATALAEAVNELILVERQQLGPTVPLESIENLPHVQEQKTRLIETFQKRWASQRWNERISEFALGTRLAGPDSLVGSLDFDRFSAWYTSAHPIRDWGHWLFGLSAGAEKLRTEDEVRFEGRAGSRFYVGTNTHKAFVEAGVSLREEDEVRWLINGGIELRLTDDLWIDFKAGTRTDSATDSDPQLFTAIRIHFSPPIPGME